MARPQKHTVDYFTHDADAVDGRTLSVLINHFGHEGHSAWWLLLSKLARSDNHVIDVRNSEDLEYLASKMHFQPDRLKEILKKMAELHAIDKPLYEAGFIWSQNFVDRLASVYEKRKLQKPVKPSLPTPKTIVSATETALLTPETPQSIVKESIVNNSKADDSGDVSATVKNLENGLLKKEQSQELSVVVKAFEDCGGVIATPMIAQQLSDAEQEYGSEVIIAAFKKASAGGHRGVRILAYCQPIFEQYKASGIPNNLYGNKKSETERPTNIPGLTIEDFGK